MTVSDPKWLQEALVPLRRESATGRGFPDRLRAAIRAEANERSPVDLSDLLESHPNPTVFHQSLSARLHEAARDFPEDALEILLTETPPHAMFSERLGERLDTAKRAPAPVVRLPGRGRKVARLLLVALLVGGSAYALLHFVRKSREGADRSSPHHSSFQSPPVPKASRQVELAPHPTQSSPQPLAPLDFRPTENVPPPARVPRVFPSRTPSAAPAPETWLSPPQLSPPQDETEPLSLEPLRPQHSDAAQIDKTRPSGLEPLTLEESEEIEGASDGPRLDPLRRPDADSDRASSRQTFESSEPGPRRLPRPAPAPSAGSPTVR